MNKTYSIEDIFEYMWSVECDHVEAKNVDDLVKELNDITKELPTWLTQLKNESK